jgi:hypothetical protein
MRGLIYEVARVYVRAYINDLGVRLGEVRRIRLTEDLGRDPRLSGAWLQLIGCALHYVRPRDFEVRTRGEV